MAAVSGASHALSAEAVMQAATLAYAAAKKLAQASTSTQLGAVRGAAAQHRAGSLGMAGAGNSDASGAQLVQQVLKPLLLLAPASVAYGSAESGINAEATSSTLQRVGVTAMAMAVRTTDSIPVRGGAGIDSQAEEWLGQMVGELTWAVGRLKALGRAVFLAEAKQVG